MDIHLPNWIVRNILVIKVSGFAEMFILLTPVPVRQTHYATSCVVMYDVIGQRNVLYFIIIVYNEKNIFFFLE